MIIFLLILNINIFINMANVFNALKPKASLNRNAFDLSQRHIFSMKCGQILPILSIDCVPNDYHEIDVLSLCRTLPVQTDAFTRLKLSFSAAFIPYQQLWAEWNEFILQTDEKFTVNHNHISYTQVPFFELGLLLKNLYFIDHDYSTGALPADMQDMFGFNPADIIVRMLDLLGYGSYYHVLDTYRNSGQRDGDNLVDENYSHQMPNLFRVLAYQKFCNDFFRNDQYSSAWTELFNVDDFGGTSIDPTLVCRMFLTLHYATWKKDYFTSLYSSPQFGAASYVTIGTDGDAQINGDTSVIHSGDNVSIDRAFNVYDLRRAEMFQKWKEDKLRAGNKLKDQSLAMFGTRPRYLMDHYCDFIGEVDSNVSIDEVTNMAASATADLGEIGGKGVGTGSGSFKYNCKDFGVLMVVAYITPTSEYDAMMLDRGNVLSEPFDFFTPAFEDLGLQSVQLHELTNVSLLPMAGTQWYNKVIGYAPRYLNYKSAVDKVHGLFMRTYSVSGGSPLPGSLSHWNTPRSYNEISKFSHGMFEEFMYVDPHVLDPIFYLNASNTQDSDQFLLNVNFQINSVRSMSVLGLPRW